MVVDFWEGETRSWPDESELASLFGGDPAPIAT